MDKEIYYCSECKRKIGPKSIKRNRRELESKKDYLCYNCWRKEDRDYYQLGMDMVESIYGEDAHNMCGGDPWGEIGDLISNDDMPGHRG